MHDSFRVPQGSARAVGWSGAALRVPQSSVKIPQGFHKAPQEFQKCSARLRGLSWGEGSSVPCARRLKSHRSSKLRAQKIASLMGGTLSKTEINGFQEILTVLSLAYLLTQSGPKCWLCGKSDHVAAGLTGQQSKCPWHCRVFFWCSFFVIPQAESFGVSAKRLWGGPGRP